MSSGTVGSVTLVVLTGATRGIGRAAAVELARRGAEVALVGRDPERVKAVAEEAVAGGGAEVHEHVADLTLISEVRRLADCPTAFYATHLAYDSKRHLFVAAVDFNKKEQPSGMFCYDPSKDRWHRIEPKNFRAPQPRRQ